MTELSITSEQLSIVQSILAAHLPPQTSVWVYGSRRGGQRHRRGSDLDLCLDAGTKLDRFLLNELHEAFVESMLPYAVDLHDRHDTSPEFLARIAPDMVRLPMRLSR